MIWTFPLSASGLERKERREKKNPAGEFKAFLLKSNALALAIGVLFGEATSKLVGSLTNDVLMPVFGKLTGGLDFSNFYINLTPGTTYENYAKAKEAGSALGYGMFINTVIDLVIIAFVVFMITKALLREKPKPAGPKTKTGPVCGESVLEAAEAQVVPESSILRAADLRWRK